jgi:hypothetical protein
LTGYDPHDLQGQDRAAADKALQTKLARDEETADVAWLMGSAQGRRIVRRLLEQAGVFRSVWDSNAMAMSFAEGKRHTGLRLLQLVNQHCPRLYPVMMREADDRKHAGTGRPKPS